MKKIAAFAAAAVIITASACSLMACGNGDGDGHTHQYDWKRTETEHWQECIVEGCGKEKKGSRATHEDDGSACPDCGAFAKVLAFGFTEGGDSAHADFAKEANEWFPKAGKENYFSYRFAGNDWNQLNDENLANYDLVMFLNNIPNTHAQWTAFKNYVENGGAWMGFHSAGFAMWSVTPATEDTSWYNYEFLRCGEYGNRPKEEGGEYWNTWNPTSEHLKVETYNHFATRGLYYLSQNEETTVDTYHTTTRMAENLINSSNANSLRTAKKEALYTDEFMSAPCEWYAWEKDLFEDSDIDVLITMNPSEDRPAGDDPRTGNEHQIWTSGTHPIAWANKNYNMVYMNWGHNLQSYNHFEKESKTFSSPEQCTFMLSSIFGLVTA
ncbi:MAG: ThuA domain-containing protein [Clostridia bacterium]|nr:ThuA domain-containing protein [Clostridia bacterium]